MNREMYKEHILEHYKNPSNFGKLEKPTHSAKEFNATCGDELQIDLNVKDNQIKKVKFTGTGCAISMASASMLTEKIEGMRIDDVKKLKKEDIFGLLGIEVNPARTKCALLCLECLKKALENGQ